VNPEKPVLVSPQSGIFQTTCEVEDTADPEVKIFRFKSWPGPHASGLRWSGIREDGLPSFPLRVISVYSYWPTVEGGDVGEKEGTYRVTAKLETPNGYVGAYEGTTKPVPKEIDTPAVSDGRDTERAFKIEDAIMTALEREPLMSLRTLKRKTNAHRFGPAFDECLKSLADEGELTVETIQNRTWVALASDGINGVITGINGNDATHLTDK
jgi:hypothetical protein